MLPLMVLPLITAVAAITVAVTAIQIINIAAEAPTMAEAATTVAASIVAASIVAARWREALHIVVRQYVGVALAARTLPTAAVAVDAAKPRKHPRAATKNSLSSSRALR